MTQAQYQWLQDNGYDPTIYDVDPRGRVVKSPVAAPATQQKMSPLRAAGTSFLGNLAPSAAGLYAGAQAGALGGSMFGPVGTVLGGLGGGLAGGYGAGKLQEKALEEFAPEALQQMAQAEQDQPVASYLGGFAPNALALKPSFGGIRGLTAPAMGMSKDAARAAFLPAAANVGVNVAGSTAGQLVNMAQGGEFSAPRFAADVALGSLFADPTKLGRRFGLQPLRPDAGPIERLDLAGENARRAGVEAEQARTAALGEDQAASARATQLLQQDLPGLAEMTGPDTRRFQLFENEKAVTGMFDQLGLEKNPELIQDLVNDPLLSNFRNDPEALRDYVMQKTGLNRQAAASARQAGAAAFEAEYAGKRTDLGTEPTTKPPEAKDIRGESIAANRKAIDEVLGRMKANPPEEFVQDLANDPFVGNLRNDPQAFQDFIAGKAEKYLESSWRKSLSDINETSRKLEESMAKEEVAEFDREQARRAEARNLGIKDIQPAREAAEEIHQRFQRPGEEGPVRITQEDLDAASEIAARRGLKLTFADLKGGRGSFRLAGPDGVPVIEIDPAAATRDTAIHEIGHDVYARSVGERMRTGLNESAMNSEAYQREYAARLAEGANAEQVHNLALEEGVIQSFGERYPNVKPGEIRQWFNALKASMKDLVGMKLSPEDAAAYLHYMTHEAVPWKGVAVAKVDVGGEERFSRAKEAGRRLGVDDLDWDNMASRGLQREVNLEDLISGVMPELKIYQEKPNVFREDVVISRQSGLLSNEGAFGRAYTTGARNEGHVVIDGALWDAAVANEPGSRERFVKVLKHELGHIDDAPNVGEYGSARDERVADEFADRYQRAQQETPEFKSWFGNSKVVDEQGKPLVVYHGTDAPDFTEFRTKTGYNFGPGAYFTPEPARAAEYARTSTGSRIYPAYVSLENPYRVTSDATLQDIGYKIRKDPANEPLLKQLMDKYDARNSDILGNGEIGNAWLREQGYDGIIKERQRYTENGFVPEILEVVAFKPEQVKSATANRGTFSPESADIRYQRGPIDRLRNFSEIDNLESRGGIFSQVAQGMRSYYATRKFMQGQASSKEQAMSSLSPERQVMLGKHIGQEFDQQRFIQPPSEIAAAYNEYRNEWQKFWPTETNKAGHTIRTAGGQRARLTDPYYGPFHMWSDSVRDIITTKQGSPEYVKLKDDYIKQHTQFHQQNGVPLQEAQTRAIAEFNDAIREMSVPYDPTAVGTFAGARKAQGIPLPESWREYNIMKLVENYDRRSAMDYAMQEHMEKSPEIMAALGAEKYFNDQPIPPQIKAAVPYIGDDNSVKSILREMSGKPARRPDELASGASRGISSLTIGTVSKATEIPTTMIAGLRYLQGSDYLPGTLKFIENLGDWSALQERSYASGLNKRDGAQNMRQVAGVIGDASGYMNKFAEFVSKYTGLNTLEKAARTMAQGWGEVLVQINKRKAATGDKEAVRMLDTLSPDWRTRSDADLAGQFGQLMQGSYDMTQLPAWMLESGAAPYLTWSKWSAGQYNNFMKFAIEPALQGNVKPLLGHLLIGVMGGAAVEQIREWMNNREGRDVNWSELESWMQQNQGELGAEGMKQLSVKLLNMVQNVGTFGIAGDLAKMVTTAAVGGTAQGMATAPVANAVFDTSKKIAAALKAIDDGEDFGLVLRQMMLDVAKSHVQVARVGQNWLDEDENLRYDDRRKRRLFDELTGAPTQSGAFSVNYGNLAEREFERGEITPQTGEEALGLVMRAKEQATTPEDYASRIRKLKTSQNAIMPSLERQPLKAARYLSWLEGTEEGLGSETVKRYLIREQEDKYRKSLVEGLSGLR